ncbi:MAG: TraV family lipoprotein [Alphaproteobacteria bacterium]|nr:TraV family lipoprotein [Alphaproteobacteria bacterium]
MTMFRNYATRGRTTCPPGSEAGAGSLRVAIPAAMIAALLLAGCTSGHVGDSWQCPLATGGACDSVAAADPAVPGAKAGRDKAPGEPLWLLPRETKPSAVEARPNDTPPCAGDCGFDPFAWLARLFAGSGQEKTAPASAGATTSSIPPRDVEEWPAEPPRAAFPAEPDAGEADTGAGNAAASQPEPGEAAETAADTGDSESASALRTGEAVARIWIAPFVDADGIYREAAWVRVVLEPAGWRLR